MDFDEEPSDSTSGSTATGVSAIPQPRVPTPGQPLGLDQVQEANAAGLIPAWQMPTGSYADVAKSWLTGANSEGMENGWDTAFFREASRQRGQYVDAAIAADDASLLLDWLNVDPNSPTRNVTATGTATWDDPTAYGRGDGKGIRKGDVFEYGRWVRNLYEDFPNDRHTADLLMADFVLEQDEKTRVYASPDVREVLPKLINDRFMENTNDVASYVTQKAFKGGTRQLQQDVLADPGAQWGNILAAGGASAAMGASVAAAPSLLGGPASPLITGLVALGSGLVGGIAAWWNRDQIAYAEARAMKVVEASNSRYGVDREDSLFTSATALREWGQVAMSAINPLQNTVQGITDDVVSDVGDGIVGYYDVDPATGERYAGGLAQGLGLAAAFGDSFIQFSNPVGQAIYIGTMGATTLGGVGQVARGSGFNERTGMFEDYDGMIEYGAAIGGVGIDAVQVFTGAGLMSLARSSRGLMGGATEGAVRNASVVRGGWVYKVDEFGAAVGGRRFSIQMLAPSEAVQAVVIGQRARQMARAAGQSGRLSADDYYRAAKQVADNSRVSAAFVTAVGEGTEEAVQAVLEPVSFSEDIDVRNVMYSAAMGAVSGAGMSTGATWTSRGVSRTRQEMRESNLAWGLAEVMEGRAIPEDEWKERWKGMTPEEKRRASVLDQREAARGNAVVAKIQSDMAAEVGVYSPIGILAYNDLQAADMVRALKDVNPEASGLYQLQARPSNRVTGTTGLQQQVYSESAALMSLFEMVNMIRHNHELTARDLVDVGRDITSSQTALERAQEMLDSVKARIAAGEAGLEETLTETEGAVAHFGRLLKDAQARQIDIQFDQPMAGLVFDTLLQLTDAYNNIDVSDVPARMRALDGINQLVVSMSQGKWSPRKGLVLSPQEIEGIRRAVEVVFIRDPRLGLSSYDLNIPQASHDLTFEAANRVVQTVLPTFKPKNADTDGDAFASLRQVYIPPAMRAQLRRGIQFFAVASTHMETDEKGNQTPLGQVRQSLADQANLIFTEAANELEIVQRVAGVLTDANPTFRAAGKAVLAELRSDLWARYVAPTTVSKPPVTAKVFREAWKQFVKELEAGIPGARENFMNALVRSNPVGFLEMSDETYAREPVYLMSRVFDMYDSLTTQRAKQDSDLQEVVTSTGNVRPMRGRKGLIAKSVKRARNAGATLQAIGSSQMERRGQQQHYGIYRSTVLAQEMVDAGFVPDLNQLLIEDYALLGGVTESEIDQIMNKYAMEDRVVLWLKQMLGVSEMDQADVNTMLMLAQAEVPNVGRDRDGDVVILKGKTTVLQLLTKRSLEIEKRRHEGKPETDPVWGKLARIERMTREQGEHSYTAKSLLMAIFGGFQLVELAGEDAEQIGAQLTMDQMLKILLSQNLTNRRKTIQKWSTQAAYVKKKGLGDPPYAQNVIEAGEINAFAIIVDSVAAMAATTEKERDRTDDIGGEKFEKGFNAWVRAVESWHKQNSVRHNTEGLTTQEEWAQDLILHQPEWARALLKAVSVDAHRAAFINMQGQITTPAWLRTMLGMTNAKQAEVFGFVYSQWEEFNAAQGTTALDPDGKPRVGDGRVRITDLKSQFLRIMLTQALEDPTRFELYSFIEAASQASSMTDLRDIINGHPNWLRGNAPWHPYTNDPAAYESSTADLFGGSNRDSIRMEELDNFAKGAEAAARGTGTDPKAVQQEKILKTRMLEYIDNGTNIGEAKAHVANAQKAIDRQMIYSDAIGPTAMLEFLGIIPQRWARSHDKAGPAEQLANLGLPVAFINSFGLALSIEQEQSALTANTAANVLTNPSRLVRTPVRIQNASGSETVADLRTPRALIEALDDPVLRSLALAVIEPVSRDVGPNGSVAMYADRVRDDLSLEEILERTARFTDVFDENIPALQRALRGIGLVEAALRQEALTLSLDHQDAMNFPILRAISDFIGVYMSSPAGDKMDPQVLVEKTVIAVWESLLLVADTPAKLRSTVQDTLESLILAQWQDPLAIFDLHATDSTKLAMDAAWLKRIATLYEERNTVLVAQLERASTEYANLQSTNPTSPRNAELEAEVAHLKQQLEWLAKSLEHLTKGGAKFPRRLFGSWETVLNKYTLEGDPVVDLKRKEMIARWLLNGRQGIRFDGKKAQPLVEALDRAWGESQEKVDILINNAKYPPEMWNELGAMAAALEIEANGALPASWTSAMALNTDPNDPKSWNKYFDRTFSSAANPLFDPYIIKAVEQIMGAATRNDRDEFGPLTAATKVFKKLFPRDLVTGEWDKTVVTQALWVQQGLSISSTKITVPIGGDAINRMAETVAVGMATDGQPKPEHYSTIAETFTLTPGQSSAVDLMERLPMLQLENHFAKSIKLTPTSGNVGARTLSDFHNNVGYQTLSTSGVPVNGHVLFITGHVAKMIDELRAKPHEMESFTLEIEYVDVDKKPNDPEYVNSPLFDGVGRDALVGGYGSPIASMFFGLGAIANVAQQRPLDALAKAGQGYRSYLTTQYDTVLQLEQGTIKEAIEAKVMWLWEKKYDFGFLLYGDLPALYKWAKSRHLVSGINPTTGEEEVWWAERYITAERTGDPGLLQSPQLISLSEQVFRRIVGTLDGSTYNGEGSYPEITLQDVDRFPVITRQRLVQLGLGDLLLKADLRESDLRRQPLLPVLRHRKPREATLSVLDEVNEARRKHANETFVLRDGTDANWSKARMEEIEAGMRPLLESYLKSEHSTLGIDPRMIPDTVLRGEAQVAAGIAWLERLDLEAPPNSMTWHQIHGKNPNALKGQFNSEDAAAGFPAFGRRGPVYGDRVLFEMQSYLMAAGNDPQEALKLLKRDIAVYSRRGVTIVLGSPTPIPEFRTMASQWMMSGEIGYVPLANTAIVFGPRETPKVKTRMQETLDSTRIATRVFSRAGITVRALHTMYGTRQGESTVLADPRYDPEYLAAAHTILPTALTGSTGNINQFYGYNLPAGNHGPTSEQAVIAKLRLLLSDPKYYAHFLKMLGEDPNMPIYREHPNGTFDPGLLGREDALKMLKDQVDAGIMPGSIGTQVMTGSLIPVVTNNGTIMLVRMGFHTPGPHEIDEQLASPPEGRKGADPHGVVVSTNRFAANWTIAPWFVVEDSHPNEYGTHLYGTYVESYISKWIDVLGSFKVAMSPIPANGQYVTDIPLGNQATDDNPLRITQFGPPQEEVSKQAIREGLLNNWRNAFALGGWDARPALLSFMGHDVDNMTDEEFDLAWSSASDLLNAYASNTAFSPETIHDVLANGTFITMVQEQLNAVRETLQPLNRKPFDFANRPEPAVNPRDFIARRVLAVLAMDGFTLADVAFSKGLIEVTDLEEVTLLPDELTATFSTLDHPEVAEYLREEINTRMFKAGVDGKPAYRMNSDWTWDVQYYDRMTGDNLLYKVMLQIIMPLPAKENAALNTQAVINRGPRASSTPHTTRIDAAALGGVLVTERDPYGRGFFGMDRMVRFGEPEEDRGFHDMLAHVSRDDPRYVRQQKMLPLQKRFIDKAGEKVAAYHHEIVRTAGWTNPLTDQLLNEFLGYLNLDKLRDRREVDYLVRQFWGAPGPFHDQQDYTEQITEELYIKALTFMLRNVRERGLHPLHGGVVPMEHQNFWEKLFKAQHGAAKPWAPNAEEGGKRGKRRAADTWDSWVTSLVSQMRASDQSFAQMFALDVAGMWQSYHGTMNEYDITSLTPKVAQNLRLMDPDTNEFLLTLDPNLNAILNEPMLLDMVDKTLDALTGMTGMYPDVGTLSPDAMTMGDRVEHITAWSKKQKLGRQKKQSFRSWAKEGQLYLESDRQLNNFSAGAIHLSIINRLFLPALWVDAYISVPFRAALEHTTDVFTGYSAGPVGRVTAEMVEKAGYTPKLSADDRVAIKEIAPSLGASNELMADVFHEFQKHWAADASSVVANKLATWANKVALLFADPRRGMRNASIGRLYMNGVIEYLASTNANVSVRQLLWELNKDPLYLQKQAQTGRADLFSAHQAGINRISVTRGFRRTFLAKALMAIPNTMLRSSSNIVQIAGTIIFIPMAFVPFTANLFVMLTGMQAVDQGMARLFDKQKNWLTRLVGFVEGSNYDPEKSEYFDMSDVLDGMNFSRSFIQSGISWTGLFTAGLIASSMGFGGEDPEERRRRKGSQRLNLPAYIDPIKPDEGSPFGVGGAEHDFRQADLIYLDETIFKNWYVAEDGRAAVAPHWIIQQYTAPVMGMAKFFETGRVNELLYGFYDAASVIPYSAVNLWQQATDSFEIMTTAADAAEDVDTPDAQERRQSLMLSAVGMLGRALVDNQFVNSVWTAADGIDRAPWLVPATDDVGTILREPGTGYPMAQEQALAPQLFTDPRTGEVTQLGASYMKRDDSGVNGTGSHAYAERSVTWAIAASLFTGQWNPMQSSFNRHNMVPAGRDIPLKPKDQDYIEAVLYSTFMGEGGQPNLTEDEIVRVLRHQYEAADVDWDQDVLESMAVEIAKAHTEAGALSVLDENGFETLTQAGTDAVLTGLWNGTLELDSPSMKGVWASREMLAAIEAEWMERMEKESLAAGLTKSEAAYRWRRFWWGNPDDPESPGLKYLFDQIPNEQEAHYTQLDVTMIMGPDGRPWATSITRQQMVQVLLPMPRTKADLGKGMTMDARANAVDEVLGINTGLNGLVKSPYIIPEKEKTPDKTASSSGTNSAPYKYKKFPSSGYSSYGPGASRMYTLPELRNGPRPDDIPFINTNAPYIRRARVNTERISSDRGRLKPWQ